MEAPKSKTTRPSKSLANIIQDAEMMLVGLKANTTEVEKRGADAAFITRLEEELKTLKTQNAEQEKLKADLKTKTGQVNASESKVSKTMSEAKKVVKLAIPQSQWKEFGINDKK